MNRVELIENRINFWEPLTRYYRRIYSKKICQNQKSPVLPSPNPALRCQEL